MVTRRLPSDKVQNLMRSTDDKPNILFLARDYQARLFPLLSSAAYTSVYVCLTRREKTELEQGGFTVGGCFEEEFDARSTSTLPEAYLETSFVSDRFLGGVPNSQRRVYLSKEIDFWNHVLDRYRPVAVVNEIVAIEFCEVMFLETKKRGIDYWAWMVSPFKDRVFYWLDTPYHGSLNLADFTRRPSGEALIAAKAYLDRILSSADIRPFYAATTRPRTDFREIVSTVRQFAIGSIKGLTNRTREAYFHPYYYDVSHYRQRFLNLFNSFRFEYDDIADCEEMVFYPLHYEPEASIIYMSEFNENQAALIRNLSKCLRHNQHLVVKEHPQQPGALLSRSFRSLKDQLSNLKYLPAEFPTKDIIGCSSIVITQTSTAGWESLLLGKPTVVLGKVFYDKHPDVNVFNSFEDLKRSIRDGRLKSPSAETSVRYVANMWDRCSEGNPFPHDRLYSNDNLRKLTVALEKRLSSEGTKRRRSRANSRNT